MKTLSMFLYSIIAYLVGFAGLLFWILSVSQLLPAISIDGAPRISLPLALLKNIGLVLLFGLQHSVMARKPFKQWLAKILPQPVERSTYVLASGIFLSLLVWQWEPIGGTLWNVPAGSILFYFIYALFFTGWAILFIATFLINHFDLFGLRQTYFELVKKPYVPLDFKVRWFYKYVRHPIYFGGIVGIWAATSMSVTHLCLAVLLTCYFIIGSTLEEKDLIRDFGSKYTSYQKTTGKLIPFLKTNKK